MAEEKKKSASHVLGGEKKKKESKKPAKKKGGKKKPVHRMHIERSANGGYIAEHELEHQPGELLQDNEKHALSDLDQLHAHLDDHFGTEDEEAEGEQPPSEEVGESSPEGLPPARRPMPTM